MRDQDRSQPSRWAQHPGFADSAPADWLARSIADTLAGCRPRRPQAGRARALHLLPPVRAGICRLRSVGHFGSIPPQLDAVLVRSEWAGPKAVDPDSGQYCEAMFPGSGGCEQCRALQTSPGYRASAARTLHRHPRCPDANQLAHQASHRGSGSAAIPSAGAQFYKKKRPEKSGLGHLARNSSLPTTLPGRVLPAPSPQGRCHRLERQGRGTLDHRKHRPAARMQPGWKPERRRLRY